MNKKGIARIIELLIALLVLTTFFAIISRSQVTYDEPQYVNKMSKLLGEVADTPDLREGVFTSNQAELVDFMDEEMNKLGLEHTYVICDYSTLIDCRKSLLPLGFSSSIDVYVADWVYIVDERNNQYSPRIMILGGWNEQ